MSRCGKLKDNLHTARNIYYLYISFKIEHEAFYEKLCDSPRPTYRPYETSLKYSIFSMCSSFHGVVQGLKLSGMGGLYNALLGGHTLASEFLLIALVAFKGSKDQGI